MWFHGELFVVVVVKSNLKILANSRTKSFFFQTTRRYDCLKSQATNLRCILKVQKKITDEVLLIITSIFKNIVYFYKMFFFAFSTISRTSSGNS